MDTAQQWCDHKSCRKFGTIGAHNIRLYSHVERRYDGTTCHHTLSADTGTFFDTRRTDRRMRLDAVAMLVERHSLRAIRRLKPCQPNPVPHWLDLAGQHAAAVRTHFIRDVHLTQAQMDDLWTFVKKNRHPVNRTTPAI